MDPGIVVVFRCVSHGAAVAAPRVVRKVAADGHTARRAVRIFISTITIINFEFPHDSLHVQHFISDFKTSSRINDFYIIILFQIIIGHADVKIEPGRSCTTFEGALPQDKTMRHREVVVCPLRGCRYFYYLSSIILFLSFRNNSTIPKFISSA